MNLIQKTSLFLAALFTVAFASTATAAGHAREGMYVGMELGFAEQEDVNLNGRDNDVPTRCDQILRDHSGATSDFNDITPASLALPRRDANGNTNLASCARGDGWSGETDIDMGVIGGFQAGYMFGAFRAEVEYLYRNHSGENRDNVTGIVGGKNQEIVIGQHGLDSLSSHSIFANLYYDFMSDSQFTPYIGAGIGFSEIDYVFDAIFARNINSVLFGSGAPDEAAATTTDANEELSDEVFGWQVVVGSDYAIDESWSVGVKFRYQQFDDPKDSAQWDRLRTHPSVVAEDDPDDPPQHGAQSLSDIRAEQGLENFDPTVTYHLEVEDIEVWAASLNLKYRF